MQPTVPTSAPSGPVVEGPSVVEVLRRVATHPIEELVHQWNWKAALLSSGWRAAMFFAANLGAGRSAAVAAATTEVVFRLATSGFYGSLTAALRRAEPAWQGMGAAMVLLPLVGHSLEGLVHWARGTAHLATSIAVSVLFTMVSTSFNVFVMRRGALLVGRESHSLTHDLSRMPALLVLFVRAILMGSVRLVRRAIAHPT